MAIAKPKGTSCGEIVRRYVLEMSIAELRNLPRIEKLRIVQLLWSDLAEEAEKFESPEWHESELRNTEREYQAGRIDILDWADVKKELRQE